MPDGYSAWRNILSLILLLCLLGIILLACLIFFDAGRPFFQAAQAASESATPSATLIRLIENTATPLRVQMHSTHTPFQPLPSRTRTQTQPPPTETLTPSPTVPSSTPTRTRSPKPTRTPGPTKTPRPPEEAYVEGVVGHAQIYSLDCEARSAVDLATFYGVEINERDFLANLPKSDNPEDGFVGNFNGATGRLPPESYGVYAKPVASLLRSYGLHAHAKAGYSWGSLKAEIAAGRPVMVWIIGNTWPGYAVDYTTPDGQETIVANYEHTGIVTGYDLDTVTLVDGDMTYQRTIEEFRQSWGVLQNMAITVGN